MEKKSRLAGRLKGTTTRFILILSISLALVFSLGHNAFAWLDDPVRPMPAFNLPSAVDGRMISSAQYRGQVLAVTFFATWCRACRNEVPNLIDLQNKYSNRNFSVLAISLDKGDPRILRDFIRTGNINYPVAVSRDNSTPDSFGDVSGLPTTFIVDRNGNIVRSLLGNVGKRTLENVITPLL